MAYRLASERVALDLDGPSVEVEPIHAWAIQRLGIGYYDAYEEAKSPEAEFDALLALYRFVVAEAQPAWDIVDHRGPVPATESGFLRLPPTLGLSIVLEWLRTGNPKASAVDKTMPPGPTRDELNRRLKAKRAA